MTDARTGPEPQSHLKDGQPVGLSADTEAAPLGDGYQRKNRGRFQAIPPGPFVRLLDIVGADQLAQQMTITASVKLAAANLPGTEANVPRCILQASWGTDGAAHDAEIDLVQGVAFALSASAIRIGARIDPLEVDPPDVLVALSIGYYPTRGRATRTIRGLFTSANPIAAGGFVNVPIPPFARRLEVLRSSLAASTQIAGTFQDRLGALLGSFNTVGPINVPIPNGAVRVVLQNSSGVADVTWSAIFALGF